MTHSGSVLRVASRYLAAKDARLDSKVKSLVNRTLIKAGLDGNKRFRTPGEALSRANNALSEHGLEWDEVINGFKVNQPKGRMNINIALTNQDDPFSPTSVENTSLAFFWDTLETGVEAIAYLG
jgi:hypothetical protein